MINTGQSSLGARNLMKNDKKDKKKGEDKQEVVPQAASNEISADDAAKAAAMLDEFGNVKAPVKKVEDNPQRKLFEDDDDIFMKKWGGPMILGPFVVAVFAAFIVVTGEILLNTWQGTCGSPLQSKFLLRLLGKKD